MTEITFTHPTYLWLLISIPLLAISHFYLLRHAHRRAMKFANFETLKRVTGKKLITKNITVLVSRVFILLFVVLAVSGSVLWYEGESNKNDFVIAIDTSASMSAEDLYPTRLEAAKADAINFLNIMRSDAKIGLVTFSGVTFVNQIMTKKHFEVKNAIEEIDIVSAGGTDLPGAIITSTNLLVNSDRGKTIILLSDGSSTAGSFLEDSINHAIAYAQDNHVLIQTIGTGTENNEPLGYIPKYYNISAVYNENTLKKISAETGGTYYHAPDNQKLMEAFKELSEESDKAILHLDLSFGLMMLATLMLLIEWGLISTKFRKIP
ncbi:MAG: VWA domain-containing protein [Nanoarchaeota archaeon]|nr:VWA domain-containing protein [Nanoarchaeota archaeon]MBU1854704.1 VWA domain-containing protein [Nanoarchaeota archaeon]